MRLRSSNLVGHLGRQLVSVGISPTTISSVTEGSARTRLHASASELSAMQRGSGVDVTKKIHLVKQPGKFLLRIFEIFRNFLLILKKYPLNGNSKFTEFYCDKFFGIQLHRNFSSCPRINTRKPSNLLVELKLLAQLFLDVRHGFVRDELAPGFALQVIEPHIRSVLKSRGPGSFAQAHRFERRIAELARSAPRFFLSRLKVVQIGQIGLDFAGKRTIYIY